MPQVYPVIHIHEAAQTVEQAGVAFEAGADGVYLIDHGQSPPEQGIFAIFDQFDAVKAAHPDRFVGINVLGVKGVAQALRILRAVQEMGYPTNLPDGLWVDDAVGEITPEVVDDLREIRAIRNEWPASESVKILGGVAFKYTPTYSEDPEFTGWLTSLVAEYVDVVTASGAGTGQAAPVDKVQAMSAVAREQGKPLAIASGVDAENMPLYADVVDEVLVATSIETEPYSGVFDRDKLNDLIQIAHRQQ